MGLADGPVPGGSLLVSSLGRRGRDLSEAHIRY